jgi:hypothetical protein
VHRRNTGLQDFTCDYVNDDYKKWRFGLGLLDWNGFTLTAIYENQDNIAEGSSVPGWPSSMPMATSVSAPAR